MFSRKTTALFLFLAVAAPLFALEQRERVIAGSPSDSLEVRHLILRGTNEEIGRALATIAAERYDARPEPAPDPLRARASRRYIEKNYPILYDRIRGVAAAFGNRVDDDGLDHTVLGFTELRGGCSIVHLPPKTTANGKSVVSRDYDYSTGNLTFGSLAPGMLHPTARPYLVELHPDRGYASIAMVAYEFLSGVLDGMNSEGLTVTMAMEDELMTNYKLEPTLGPATGLGVLQTMRMLLDTCATVDEAKEALLMTKQYYEYVPVHFLIADRFGNAFIWEYSESHNKEYIIENAGKPLVMTNFSTHKHLDGEKPPSADMARATCRRYAHLAEHLAVAESITEELLRKTHGAVDAQAPARADQKRPPIRTFWHALYYPEERRAKFSFYLRDDPVKGIVRSDYIEVKLDATNAPVAATPVAASTPTAQTSAQTSAQADPSEQPVIARLQEGGAGVKIERGHVTAVGFKKGSEPAALLPLLAKLPKLQQLGMRDAKLDDAGLARLPVLPRLETISLANTQITDASLAHLSKFTGLLGIILEGTKVTDAGLSHLKTIGRLTKLNLKNTAVTDAGVAAAKKMLPWWAKIER